MYPSEKRSLYRFLAIYLFSTFFLFSLGSYIFYSYEKHNLLDQQRKSLQTQGSKLRHQLMVLHRTLHDKLPFIVDKPYKCALYDIDKNLIFATDTSPKQLQKDEEYYLDNSNIVHIVEIDPYYLGVSYLLINVPINQDKITNLQIMIVLFMLGAGFFFLLIGYFLGRLFIAPMRDSITTMNRFIQDTTHELNTPISTILTNLELIDTLYECEAKKEMQRIEIASKTLSRIYDDLTYLKLNHNYNRDIRVIDISALLKERLLYFSSAIQAKDIELVEYIDQSVLIKIDRDDAIRLIDNLLSNAIKYNISKGRLETILTNRKLTFIDSGIGIENKDLKSILNRFRRANGSEGGFGIGLHIVDQIVQNYHFTLALKSKLQEGTEVTITW